MRGPNHYLTQAGNLARDAEDESRRLEKFPPLDPRRAHDGCASDWIGELSFADLRTLYRGIRCMDSDFTRDKVLAEVAYHLRGQRADWEEINGYTVKQQEAAAEQSARDLERSRPDMYGWYSMQNGLPIAPGSPEPDIKVAP